MKRTERASLKPIKSVLIANRGEIACRIAATCKKLGIRSIAVYSSADQGALHTKVADESVFIGEATPAKSYLNIEAIIAAAKQTGAEAIHPGYGFLSENAEFADACERAKIIFIGPTSKVIALMGNKIAAKELAQKAGVPLVMGISLDGNSQNWSKQAEAFAKKAGYPLLIKAGFGGGGRGMRVVKDKSELGDALAGASREAQAFFGNGSVFVERLLVDVRHIEVQVLGDQHGNLFTLFDRDCSLQRNHQKVVEEAPAPFVKPETRNKIHQSAAALCKMSKYSNAGTVEFLLDREDNFYFLEVNSRLQVEHPVTEAITGIDLVELQIKAAQGEDLSACLKDIEESAINGHAIECRICAESPEEGFMPSSGKVELIEFPHSGISSSVRVDTGFSQGSSVSHYYDSLIAKLIVHGNNREAVIRDTVRVLQSSSVFGVKSNISYLIELLSRKEFHTTKHHIKFAESVLPAGAANHDKYALIASFAALAELAPSDSFDAWRKNSSWRLFRSPSIIRSIAVAGQIFQLTLCPQGTNSFNVVAESKEHTSLNFEFRNVTFGHNGMCCLVNGQGQSVSFGKAQGPIRWLRTDFGSFSYEIHQVILKRSSAVDAEHAGLISSSLPGRIVAVKVKKGDKIAQGAVLLVIESMKMEHPLTAPFDGKVLKVAISPGSSVEAGATLVELAPSADSA